MTQRSRFWPCALVLSIAMTAGGARATTVLPQNLEQLESQAQLVFVGTCTSRTAALNAQGLPIRVYTFEIGEVVKGNLKTGGRLEVRQFGNDVAAASGLAMRIAELPSYRVGQEALLFLNPPGRLGLTSPVGLSQGLFPVVRERDGRRQILLDPLRREMLTRGVDAAKYAASARFTPAERDRLAHPPERLEVSEFCALVQKVKEEREQAEKER